MFTFKNLIPFVLIPAASGCGITVIPISVGSQNATFQEIQLTVLPAYPNHGANWNDYVKNDGTTVNSASDTACLGSETPYSACLEAGEIRKVVVAGITSCSGLTMTDALDVFTWGCQVVNGTATFFSSLNSTKGLRDLVTAAGWNQDSVTLTGTVGGASTSAAWWSNPVQSLNSSPYNNDGTGMQTLSGTSTIYVAAANQTTDGYYINADKLALVTLAGVTLTWNNAATFSNCNYVNGTTTSPDDGCVVIASAHKFYWIEADIDGSSTGGEGILLSGASFAQVYRTSTQNGCATDDQSLNVINSSLSTQVRQFVSNNCQGDGGIWVGAQYSLFQNITVTNLNFPETGTAAGIYFSNFNGNAGGNNVIDGLMISNSMNGADGVYAEDNGGNSFHNVLIDQVATGYGIWVKSASAPDTFDEVLVSNAGSTSFYDQAGNTVMTRFISTNNQAGVLTGGSTVLVGTTANGTAGTAVVSFGGWIDNALLVNNGTSGLGIFGTTYVSQLASNSNNSGDGNINVQANGNLFMGNLLLQGVGYDCFVVGGSPGLAGNCAPAGSSSQTNTTIGPISGSSTFGFAASSDSANLSGPGGTALYPGSPSLFDWLDFQNIFRSWGQDTTPGQWTSGTGYIMDWELLASGGQVFDNTLSVSAKNQAFSSGSACPSAVGGNVIAVAGGHTYLLNAVEITSPMVTGYSATGNHNGLCETGESCIYMPNFGAYQGSGTLEPCAFTGGTVTGVTMYGYTSNGI